MAGPARGSVEFGTPSFSDFVYNLICHGGLEVIEVSDLFSNFNHPYTRACHQLSQTTLATSWTAARKFRAVFS